MDLYHGSYDPKIKAHNFGLFGSALFFSGDKNAANSHGSYVHKISVDAYLIASTADLENFTGFSEIMTDLVIYEESVWALDQETFENIFSGLDRAEAAWQVQSKRFELAKSLGFLGVFVNDEHGQSVMIDSFEFFGDKAA